MGSFILAEKIYVGGVLGAVLIVIGLYSVLWGKYKEYKEMEAEQILEPVKIGNINNNNNNNNNLNIGDIEANNNNNIAMENRMYVQAIAISGPMPQPPMLALEAPKP
ncbi:hypothetical protein ABFS83_10G153900 [Erythranthe nasuta]